MSAAVPNVDSVLKKSELALAVGVEQLEREHDVAGLDLPVQERYLDPVCPCRRGGWTSARETV